jgi:hypothetical protein
MKKKYTVFCFCCCGCDQNEIHLVEARGPKAAIKPKLFNDKRIIAVIKGHHQEARRTE